MRFNNLGNPTDYGNNIWHAYVYNTRNRDNLLTSNYYGYYTESLLSYSTLNRWTNTGTPSSASGYKGCTVGVDNHTISYKRRGFPCKVYQLNVVRRDDDSKALIDGVQVWSVPDWSPNPVANIWTGVLDANSTIEFVNAENTGGSNQALDFIDVTTALNAGLITAPATIVGCTGFNPATINNGTSASGGSSASITNGGTTSYQWKLNGLNIGGATGATYNPSVLSVGTYNYTRVATDRCGSSATSNSITITVVADPSTPTITKSPNSVAVCVGTNITVTSPSNLSSTKKKVK